MRKTFKCKTKGCNETVRYVATKIPVALSGKQHLRKDGFEKTFIAIGSKDSVSYVDRRTSIILNKNHIDKCCSNISSVVCCYSEQKQRFRNKLYGLKLSSRKTRIRNKHMYITNSTTSQIQSKQLVYLTCKRGHVNTYLI
jgi:hypothetical protein